ncbi:DUF4232 domain-containing protein [Streptomyces avicenniae]|uniref:DUF4232 domain-containing protein n=1 Tax=Streptomyces avicenniae TaxID=500153 RepID=UPI00069AD478|nr:DUF4232 domain-containing protein [Streptomyces avicenniae]
MILLSGARRRTLLLVVPAVLLAAACAPGTTEREDTSAPSAPASPVQPERAPEPAVVEETCPPEGVRLGAGPVDAAMGLRAMRILLTNCGDEPRTVSGHPSLTVLDEESAPLDVEITHDPVEFAPTPDFAEPPGEVVIPPDGVAYAVLMWRNTVTDATVVATLGTGLSVVVTEDGTTQTVEPDGGLDLGNTGLLAVSPWLADTNG